MEEEDIILADLDDEELVQQMFDDLYDGLKEMRKGKYSSGTQMGHIAF